MCTFLHAISDLYVFDVCLKEFLTIAIPTIKRRNDSYLIETVKALISKMNTTEQDEVVIVIMLADLEKEKRQFLANHIEENLLEDLQRGLIHVIQPPEEYYASLKVSGGYLCLLPAPPTFVYD